MAVILQPYEVRLRGGRSSEEGLVEAKINGQWGAICADRWTLFEADPVCKQLGKGHARSALQVGITIAAQSVMRVMQ